MDTQATVNDGSLASLRDIFTVVFKYKVQIGIIMLVSVMGALGYLAYVGNSYEAELKILILQGPEKLSAINNYTKDDLRVIFQERGEDIANEKEIIQDKQITLNVLPLAKEIMQASGSGPKTLLQRAKEFVHKWTKKTKDFVLSPLYSVGLATRLTPDQELALEMAGGLHVEFLEVTNIVRLTFEHSNPAFAATVLNLYAEEYVRYRTQILQSKDSKGFYDDQIALYQDKLNNSENAVADFRAEAGISDPRVQRETALNRIAVLDVQIADTERQLEDYVIARDAVKDAASSADRWVMSPELGKTAFDFTTIDNQYFALAAKRNELRLTFMESSREITNINAQIALLRQQKASVLLAVFETRLKALNQTINSLKEERSGHKRSVEKLDHDQKSLVALERERELMESTFLSYKKKAEDLRITDDLNKRQITSVRIISPAAIPIVPSSPKKWLILQLSVVFGLFLGIGFAVMARFFDHTFRSPEDVAKVLGLPTYTTIPLLESTSAASAAGD